MGQLENKEEKMKPFEKCPICGGEIKSKEVEKLLRGGNHTAVLRINAEVCLHCGERLYPENTVRLFEQIRNKLKRQEVSEFNHLGHAYRVDNNLQHSNIHTIDI